MSERRHPTLRRAAIVVASAVLSCASACGPSADELERQRIIAAISALRSARPDDVDGRLALADALAKESAKTPEAVRARDVCAKGYRLLAESRRAEDAVAKGIASSDKDSAITALRALDEAQKKLDEARAAVDECGAANTALILKK